LGRMNTDLVEAALSAHGRRLMVIDDAEMDDDLVRDMTEVLTIFCAQLCQARRWSEGSGTAEWENGSVSPGLRT
ncbi:MAG: hypothetical protein M0Z91_06830, partial [Actinomycetota bacterium]|nr:hypothetical protein [Actinomycetota bacterium]